MLGRAGRGRRGLTLAKKKHVLYRRVSWLLHQQGDAVPDGDHDLAQLLGRLPHGGPGGRRLRVVVVAGRLSCGVRGGLSIDLCSNSFCVLSPLCDEHRARGGRLPPPPRPFPISSPPSHFSQPVSAGRVNETSDDGRIHFRQPNQDEERKKYHHRAEWKPGNRTPNRARSTGRWMKPPKTGPEAVFWQPGCPGA